MEPQNNCDGEQDSAMHADLHGNVHFLYEGRVKLTLSVRRFSLQIKVFSNILIRI